MDQLGLVWDRPSLAEATQRRDVGIQRAADHAEREAPGWGELALEFLTDYAAGACGPFLAEDVVRHPLVQRIVEAYAAHGQPGGPDTDA